MTYTKEDFEVLLQMCYGSNTELNHGLIEAYKETNGTLHLSGYFSNGRAREFLAAKFEDIPKYIGESFDTLIKWRLQIGR